MDGLRGGGELRERLAGFAALAVALACILCCGKGGPAWSKDGERVVFDYTTDAEHAALADYHVESGRIRTLWSEAEYSKLCAIEVAPDDSVVFVGTVDSDRADVLVLDPAGEARLVRRFDQEGVTWMVKTPCVVRDGSLWFTRAGDDGSPRYASCRLDLRTAQETWPFGERWVLVAAGKAGDFYVEGFEHEGRIEFGRVELATAELEHIGSVEAEALGHERISLASLSFLVVGREHFALVLGVPDGHATENPETPVRVLFVHDLAGTLVLRREIPAGTGADGSLLFSADDRHLIWLAVVNECLAIQKCALEDGAIETVELTLPGRPPVEWDAEGISLMTGIALSPNGRHLAVSLDSPPGSDVPDLLLFDLHEASKHALSVRVPRGQER